MLRWELGDELFFEILRIYYEEYKYSNASTNDFRLVCEKVSNKDFTKFFDQWIYGVGRIELSYEWGVERFGDSYFTFLNVNQKQENYEEYHFSLEIALEYENDTEYQKFYIDKKTLQLRIESNQLPEDIILDPNNWLLITTEKE